ncbi:hypothetical protein OROMI_003283 [Orobanche minor]
MAMAKQLTTLILLLAFIAISTLTPTAVASQYHLDSQAIWSGQLEDLPAPRNVKEDASRHGTRNPVCSSATCAVRLAAAFHRGIMGTRPFALATTTGRHSKEDQNALDRSLFCLLFLFSLFSRV